MAEWKEQVLYWKRKLEKGVSTEKTLQILQKLQKVPITVALLQETGIGKVVNGLRKQDGEISDRAKLIVSEWKQIVSRSSSQNAAEVPQTTKHDQHRYSEKEHRRKHENSSHKNHKKYTSYNSGQEENSDEEVEGEEDDDVDRNSSPGQYEQQNYASGEDQANEIEDEQDEDDDNDEISTHGNDRGRASHASHLGSASKHNESYHDSRRSKNSHSSREMEHSSSKMKNDKLSLASSDAHRHHEKHLSKSSSYQSSANVHKHSDERETKHKSSKKGSHAESNINSYKKEKKNSSVSHESSHKKSSHHEQNDTSNHKTSKSSKAAVSSGSSNSQKSKILKTASTEGFDNSMASFEDILGLNDAVKMKKKKPASSSQSKPSTSSEEKKKSSKQSLHSAQNSSTQSSGQSKDTKSNKRMHDSDKEFAQLVPRPKAPPLEQVDILSTLPAIQPNYKPLPFREPDSPPNKKKLLTSEDALMLMTSRKDRTMVYSGRRTNYLIEVPSLYESCMKVLMENVDTLAYTGGVPYDILKPVLERCTPNQLYNLEDYNPYLLEDSDELWQIHCQRDFKGRQPEEGETWREQYLRLLDEREAKLKSITANISASMAKAVPVRQTKLAYVETVAKPPRDVARRQAKYGTGLPVNHPQKGGPPSKATPRPIAPVINTVASTSTSQAKIKPKVAPLMQKTLKFMKNRFRR